MTIAKQERGPREVALRGRPDLGTSVLVANPLGPGTVLADLESSGFRVVAAVDGDVAMKALRAGTVDVALVEGRFLGDGLAFCHQLWAERPGFPVLMMGPNDENLVTQALTSGADDYLVLPLRPAELVARVRAVLRRAARGLQPGPPVAQPLEVGDVRLDPHRHEVTLRGAHVHLPLREFQLLRLLMENAGIVLSRATLMARLWSPRPAAGSTSLEVPIRRLRSKLEEAPGEPKRIVTVRGVGYRYQGQR